MNIAGLTKAILILSLFTGTTAFPGELDCRSELGDRALTFAEIAAQIKRMKSRAGAYYSPTENELKIFVQSGLPYLKKLSDESGSSLSSIFEEYFAVIELMDDGSDDNPYMAKSKAETLKDIRIAFKHADELANRAKLKQNHWNQVRKLVYGIKLITSVALILEVITLPKPSFNPFLPFDAGYIQRLLNSIEDSTFERLLAYQEYRNAKRNSQEANKTPTERISTPEWTSPVISEEIKGVEAPSHRTLAELLKSDADLNADQSYTASTVFGHSLTVELSPSLAKEYANGERIPIKRLLKGILTGRGDKSGIKTLFEIGPDIIELKAVMNGHKRILGCLDGTTLRLKKFVDIKESRATYFKQIPKNFCL